MVCASPLLRMAARRQRPGCRGHQRSRATAATLQPTVQDHPDWRVPCFFQRWQGTNSPTPHRRQAIRPASKEPDGLYQNCSDQQRRICKLLELCRWLQSPCCAPAQCMSPAAARHRRQSCAHCRWLIPVSNRANSLQRSLRCRFRPTRRCRR